MNSKKIAIIVGLGLGAISLLAYQFLGTNQSNTVTTEAPVTQSEQERIDRAIELARQMAMEDEQQDASKGNKPNTSPSATSADIIATLGNADVPTIELTPAQKQVITNTIDQWKSAWVEQNVDQYLSFYSPGFVPAGDITRDQWAALRRQRITSQTELKINIQNLKLESKNGKVIANFSQDYKSSKLSEISAKTLVLENQGDRWLIIAELAK